VVDQDWVYREAFLYDLGGLARFVETRATPDLLVGADAMREWAQAPMGGFRLVGSDSHSVTWHDLAADERRAVANVGSAVFVQPGEHVIGRLVPVEGGAMFETQPLLVPRAVAHRVAERPDHWVEALRSAQGEPGEAEIVTHGRHHQCLLSDVPPVAWQLAVDDLVDLTDETTVEEYEAQVARAVLDRARLELADPSPPVAPDTLDVWPCLGAALLEPFVFTALLEVTGSMEREVLWQLGERLAEPAASVCAQVVEETRDAA
jgi:hypothetical protein